MSTIMSNIDFKMMSLFMKILRKKTLINQRIKESRIKEGDYVLDFACGPGIFTFPIASIVGDRGKVIAADIHPLAKKKIEKKAVKMRFSNVEFFQTDCQLPIPNNYINVALLFDCIHSFHDVHSILVEIHRVLHSDGLLSIDFHHIKKEGVMQTIEKSKLFEIVENQKNVKHLLYKPRK